jgi:inhibitor of KinA sporulation pathway (predicted exonuclease)
MIWKEESMHYIVFDLEWNIAGRVNKVDPETLAALPFEIIEIGAVKLDENFKLVSKYSNMVRPKIYPILSGHIAAVTKRFQQSMKFGLSFTQAAVDFQKWCGEDAILCTWSESDSSVFKSNLRYHGLPDDLPKRCLDVQHLFDELVEQSGMQRSIEYAVDFLRLPKSQPFHQAVNDAWYTGAILQQVASIASQEQAINDLHVLYAYDPNLNRSYRQTLDVVGSHDDALVVLQQEMLSCPACGGPLQRLADWDRQGSKALAAFSCPEHGRINGKARFRIKGKTQVIADLAMRLDKGAQNQVYEVPGQGVDIQNRIYEETV